MRLIKLSDLNKEELVYGACFGMLSVFCIKWFAVIPAILCAYLWALSGYGESKLYRRLLCPIILFISCVLVTHRYWSVLSVLGLFGVLSMGYGIPTYAPGRTDNDEGSTLGRFYWNLFDKDVDTANIYTRLTIVGLIILISLPIIVR